MNVRMAEQCSGIQLNYSPVCVKTGTKESFVKVMHSVSHAMRPGHKIIFEH